MNTSYNSSTLSRCQTPNLAMNTANRPSPSPKCFGRNTHVLKEEYERERLRWQQKLEEVEQKLTEASINNSELFQIKAELNRKIIDFEKNQRPLIEQNRRLNDRIRVLNVELKKFEEKLSYAQDDFLSLRDAYDRLVKENSMLKEQRAFPEKLEELGRYRSQVLEYSKCITALRQSAIEKDRRYEMLVQKFKKYRKCFNAKRNSSEVAEDDRQSCIGSEGSMDSSLICLDTIAEDLDEDMDLASAELFSASMSTTEYSLKQQLDLANMTIVELQNTIECENFNTSNQFSTTIERLNKQIRELKDAKKGMETELANTQHHNELLEFQLTELTEGSQRGLSFNFSDKQCSTELEIGIGQNEIFPNFKHQVRLNVSLNDAVCAGKSLTKLLQENAAIFKKEQFDNLKSTIEILDGIQNQLSFTETELNMTNCELNRSKRQFKDEIIDLKNQNEESTTKKQQKKKELQNEINQLKKEKKEEQKKSIKQVQELHSALDEQTKDIVEKTKQICQLKDELKEASEKVESQATKITFNESTIDELKAQFETLAINLTKAKSDIDNFNERTRVKLLATNGKLEKMQKDSQQQIDALKSENQNLLAQLECQSTAKKLLQIEVDKQINALRDLQTKHALEQSDFEKQFCNSFQQSLCTEEVKRKKIEVDKARLERELIAANAQIMALKDQIRPIGNQLERRYEESRYRLKEAVLKISELENCLDDKQRRALFQNGLPPNDTNENEKNILKIKQLEAYNRELEDQFNSQMDIIVALKKKFIVMNGNNQSVDSIGWTSNSSEGTNSIDDEQYHSEGSDAGPTINAKIN